MKLRPQANSVGKEGRERRIVTCMIPGVLDNGQKLDTGFVRSTQRERESRAPQMRKEKEAGSHLFQELRTLSKSLD